MQVSCSGDGGGGKLMPNEIIPGINTGVPILGYLRGHIDG